MPGYGVFLPADPGTRVSARSEETKEFVEDLLFSSSLP